SLSWPRNAIQLRLRPQEHAAPQNGRRGHRHLVQRILSEQLEFRSRLHDERVAVFAQEKDLPVVAPRRGREATGFSRNALTPVDFFSGLCVVTQKEPAIEQRVV